MRKKVLSVVLAALLLGSASALAPIDILGSDVEEDMQRLLDLGVLNRDEDGDYRPEQPMARAEIMKILVAALAEAESGEPASQFNDIDGHWAEGAINRAYELGIVSGYPDGSFRPDDSVKIGEAITMLIRAIGYREPSIAGAQGGAPFAWPDSYLNMAVSLGICDGDEVASEYASRGAVASFVANALETPLGGAWQTSGETMLSRLTGAPVMPAEVKAIADAALESAKTYAARLDGAYGDAYSALLAEGQGRADKNYADLAATLNGFRMESGARYVYILTDVNPDDSFLEITVDGSEEPDEWMRQYEIEGQFLVALSGRPAAAKSAWEDDDGIPVWSAFAPVRDSKGVVAGILGVDSPAEAISSYPEWNRDNEAWNGLEYEYDHVDAALLSFEKAIDIPYTESVIEKLRSFGNNPDLGFRNAGSPAEIAAGDYIASEMRKHGFTVTKDPVTLDTWEFKNASLRFTDAGGREQTALLAAEMIEFQADDKEYDVIYAGMGTEADYEGLDASGKAVLVDVNQVENWWINWPAYQAKAKGAAVMIAVSSGGYATYSDETLGVQDYCGPSDVPALNISIKDGELLKAAIKAGGGSAKINLTVDSRVEFGGTAYNIIAELPGKSASGEAISFIGHYDAYFRAFDDNSSGVGAMMGIAKALSESGYEPERTFRFVFHAGEEWGFADSRYDWAAGAWAGVQKHPEWAENTFMAINLDGGLIDGSAAGVRLRAPYEFANMIGSLGRSVEGSPFEGFDVSSPLWTWTEGWGYSISGIPVFDSGLSGSDHEASYHTNSDTAEANHYDAEAYAFGHKLYGSLAILLDRARVREMDYTDFFNAFSNTIDESAIVQSAVLQEAVAKAQAAAEKLNAKAAFAFTDAQAAAFNKAMNGLYKKVQQDLFTIDWNEEVQFVHEYKQTNVNALKEAVAALAEGDAATAVDDLLWQVDLNWYAYDFDRETYDYFVEQVLGPNAKNSWGTGYLQSNADLFDVIRSLMDKYGDEAADLSGEIAALKAELAKQEADLDAVCQKEILDLKAISAMMEDLAS
ncbi:MAG: S-layer homology domain-containing protein [Clostridiales bacterium]|nr:S-layer homology domain-containing protein [Clostridiales bacterium]